MNAMQISREFGWDSRGSGPDYAESVSNDLAAELKRKGIRGFKRGGRVRRTGIYKLHRGEHVIPARHKRRTRRK